MEGDLHLENTTRITPKANKKGAMLPSYSIPEAFQGSGQPSSAGWGRTQFDAIASL